VEPNPLLRPEAAAELGRKLISERDVKGVRVSVRGGRAYFEPEESV
jgi:hypothetical protein